MAVTVKWLGHASFRICSGEQVIYIDPWKISEARKDAKLVLVSHSHYDHFSAQDIAKVAGPDAKIVGPQDVIRQYGGGQVLEPGQSIEFDGLRITGVASYNPGKQFHPRSNNWLGFVIELESLRIYYAGDTDFTEQMKQLSDIDLALLPVGGTYTMGPEDAIAAVNSFKPRKAVPYHWGDIVGDRSDAERFAEGANCQVTILEPGQQLELSAST